MPEKDDLLKGLFLDKPELVIGLSEKILPADMIEVYRSIPGLAIVEMAGRDSVAAAIKAVEQKGFTDLLPTYAYTGTEYGPWLSVIRAVERLAERLPDTNVHDLLVMGSPAFWQALNGRFVSDLITRYGCFTPCVGCHLYLHSVRIPLAKALGNVPVISGERESHDGIVKINQVKKTLDRYQYVAKHFEIPVLFPLRKVQQGSQIEKILGFDWAEGREQLGCVLSGNYRHRDKSPAITEKDVLPFLDEYAVPCTIKIIETYLSGDVPDHTNIAGRILTNLNKTE